MHKFIIPAAALLLVATPTLSTAETTDTRVEERVEHNDDGDSKTTERSVETEQKAAVEHKSQETKRTERVDTDDGGVETEVHERSEKKTVD